jgi:nucleoside phosphorylase
MARKMVPRLTLADYSVSWICALPQEFAAARAMLDDKHGVPDSRDVAKRNVYSLGRMGVHNIAIACLPAGVPGATPAATVATDMQRTFKRLRFGLLVGVGSGAPSASDDIRLGDVVVSRSTHEGGGVISFEQAHPTNVGRGDSDGSSSGRCDHFVRGQCLNAPLTVLLTAQPSLETEHMLHGSRICEFLAEAAQRYPRMKPQFAPPLAHRGDSSHNNGCSDEWDEVDKLYEASYVHPSGSFSNDACGRCNARKLVRRPACESSGSLVHYGAIASSNEEIECSITLGAAKAALGMLCFEREAAGLMNNFPCLVIRGICDYADTHKSKDWLGYAAAAAAACAKELLEMMPPQEVQDMATIEKVLNDA